MEKEEQVLTLPSTFQRATSVGLGWDSQEPAALPRIPHGCRGHPPLLPSAVTGVAINDHCGGEVMDK